MKLKKGAFTVIDFLAIVAIAGLLSISIPSMYEEWQMEQNEQVTGSVLKE